MITIGEVDRAELPALYERCAEFVQLDPESQNLDNLPPGYTIDASVLRGIYEDARLVGIYGLIIGYPKGDALWIGLLMLEPSARGRGVGRDVLTRILQDGEAAGVRIFGIAVHEQNEPALRFWERFGFAETNRHGRHVVMRRG
jgi:RimJ/RimL family protein N-acetyltransferase